MEPSGTTIGTATPERTTVMGGPLRDRAVGSLKPRQRRVFTLRASIPAAALAEALGEFVAVRVRCNGGAGE
jgi:hypothetical protein